MLLPQAQLHIGAVYRDADTGLFCRGGSLRHQLRGDIGIAAHTGDALFIGQLYALEAIAADFFQHFQRRALAHIVNPGAKNNVPHFSSLLSLIFIIIAQLRRLCKGISLNFL